MSSEEGEALSAPASPSRLVIDDVEPVLDEREEEDGPEPVAKKRGVSARSSVARFMGYIADPEFDGHGLVLLHDRVYCRTCGVVVGAGRRALVVQHIWGDQYPSSERRAAMAAGTCDKRTAHMDIIVGRSRTSESRRTSGGQTSMHDYAKPAGSVPPASLNRREDVAEAFMCAGFSFYGLESPLLRGVLESLPAPLGGRQGVSKTVPTVTKRTLQRYKDELANKQVAVMFDGGEINYKLQATLVRFVAADMSIKTLAIGAKRVGNNMTGQDISDILRDHLSRVGVQLNDVKLTIADRCSVNIVAHRVLLGSVNVREEDRDFPLFGCLCHTLNNAGGAMQEMLPLVTRFMALWKKMRKSTLLVSNFRSTFDDMAFPTYTAVRWWSMQHAVAALEPVFHSIPSFLRQQKKTTCQATIASLLDMLSSNQCRDRFRLEIQLFVVKSTAKPLVDASLVLQSNGFVAAFVADVIENVDVSCVTWCGAHGSQEIANKVNGRLNAYRHVDNTREAGTPMFYPWVNDAVFVNEVRRELYVFFVFFGARLTVCGQGDAKRYRLYAGNASVFPPENYRCKCASLCADGTVSRSTSVLSVQIAGTSARAKY